MFNVLLRQFGYRRTMTPFVSQIRQNTYKREVVKEDTDPIKYNDKFNDNCDKLLSYSGRDLYYPKYGTSIYDDKIIDDFKKK
jgi:hypothetical protein